MKSRAFARQSGDDVEDPLRIGEVAAQAGVSTSKIRYYEAQGVLPVPARVNGRRRYRSDAVIALAVIDLAKQAGFTLKEIKTLLHGFSDDLPPPERWKILARTKLIEVDEQMQRLTAMKLLLREGLDCDCLGLDDCAVLVAHPHGIGANR